MIVLFPGRPFEPTAQMFVADTASIPLRKLSAPAMGLGLATTLNACPFQCSISVRLWPPASGVSYPTAHALVGLIAVTPSSSVVVPLSGAAWIDHLVPFQCSTSGLPAAPLLPTAQMLVADSASMPYSWSNDGLPTSGCPTSLNVQP